jgi:hypothetical protein
MNIDSLREKLIFQQSLFSMGSEWNKEDFIDVFQLQVYTYSQMHSF